MLFDEHIVTAIRSEQQRDIARIEGGGPIVDVLRQRHRRSLRWFRVRPVAAPPRASARSRRRDRAVVDAPTPAAPSPVSHAQASSPS